MQHTKLIDHCKVPGRNCSPTLSLYDNSIKIKSHSKSLRTCTVEKFLAEFSSPELDDNNLDCVMFHEFCDISNNLS